MRFKRTIAALAATAALAAGLFMAVPASAAKPDPRAVARSVARANVDRAAAHTAFADRGSGRSVLTSHGANWYCPAAAWTNGGGTVTACYEYSVEELAGGCRPGVLTFGYLNGNPWSLDYKISGAELVRVGVGAVKYWAGPYSRYGNGFLAPAVADGLYHPQITQDLFGDFGGGVATKGASESTWHYHYGNSGDALINC